MLPLAGPATSDSPFTKIGLSVYRWASSARTTIAAAEPSETPEQSNTPEHAGDRRGLGDVSLETSLRNWARELRAPL